MDIEEEKRKTISIRRGVGTFMLCIICTLLPLSRACCCLESYDELSRLMIGHCVRRGRKRKEKTGDGSLPAAASGEEPLREKES